MTEGRVKSYLYKIYANHKMRPIVTTRSAFDMHHESLLYDMDTKSCHAYHYGKS